LPEINIPTTDPNQLRSLLSAMLEGFSITEERLPPDMLEHRVTRWLTVGTQVVNPRLSELKLPVLIVAGEDDRLMPSKQEAVRLSKILPRSEKLVVKGRGHFVLDEDVNLTEAILYSKIDPLSWDMEAARKSYDPITDWRLPDHVHDYIDKTVKPFRDALSPVYFSTDEAGKRWKGLGKVPRPDKPLVVVANHQFGK
jgi:hypothetical protein